MKRRLVALSSPAEAECQQPAGVVLVVTAAQDAECFAPHLQLAARQDCRPADGWTLVRPPGEIGRSRAGRHVQKTTAVRAFEQLLAVSHGGNIDRTQLVMRRLIARHAFSSPWRVSRTGLMTTAGLPVQRIDDPRSAS